MTRDGTTTVFLDAGNTLISMNFEWVAAELAECGVMCDVETLRRAEARARPGISAHTARAAHVRAAPAEGTALFEVYLAMILSGLPAGIRPDARGIERICAAVTPKLKAPGCDHRLWSWVMPGVPAALERLAALGLDLVVVSNSDGSVERALDALGLMTHLRAVVDSHLVGYEKPDPRIFAHALELVAADSKRSLHVGDMYHQDVVGARQAGILAVLLDPFDDWSGVDCERLPDLGAVADRLEAETRRGP